MEFPPSLSRDVLTRAFRAPNREIGILPTDADPFLTACEIDQVELLGWEVWLIDHRYDPESSEPIPSPSSWCGVIPTLDGRSAIFGGEGNRDKPKNQIRATELELPELVDAKWIPYLRYNFTLV